ncbi:GNAT family N-acetyltransferase [Marinobacter hydrocarbonoclasticus]|nr:GNAT family N-acetyltransferase [Marinobacter nauticus]
MTPTLRAEFVSSLSEVCADDWDSLLGAQLFTQYHYLNALEQTGCVEPDSGWLPHHLLLYRGDALVAAMPLYIKLHSYGEYLFDWSWARAYEQHGLEYYPKLVSAIPYTAITGPRLGIARDEDARQIQAAVAEALTQRSGQLGGSGAQVLFMEPSALPHWTHDGWYQRRDLRYQWQHQGETDFDQFLARFKSRKRKMVRKERSALSDKGIETEVYEGRSIEPQLWQTFIRCYQTTYLKRSGHSGYLTPAFFNALASAFTDRIVMMVARHQQQVLACALYLVDGDTLYGRYWGALVPVDGLHFELCYYQGIEYCLRRGLTCFDPGVQGEHKLARGFEPTFSYGAGLIHHRGFAPAIHRFCQQEWEAIGMAEQEARMALPFKQTDD